MNAILRLGGKTFFQKGGPVVVLYDFIASFWFFPPRKKAEVWGWGEKKTLKKNQFFFPKIFYKKDRGPFLVEPGISGHFIFSGIGLVRLGFLFWKKKGLFF